MRVMGGKEREKLMYVILSIIASIMVVWMAPLLYMTSPRQTLADLVNHNQLYFTTYCGEVMGEEGRGIGTCSY